MFKGEDHFFSRLDPSGLFNKKSIEKITRIKKIINNIYDRISIERDDNNTEAIPDELHELKIVDESPHGVSMVSLHPDAIDFADLKVKKIYCICC